MRTVLFDLDGTLVDSAALITQHLAGALRAVDAEVPGPAVLMSLVGPPFETALPAVGLTAEQTAAAILHYRSTYDPVAAEQSVLFPGIPALLEKLDATGLRMAIATSKPERTATRIAVGLGIADRFALIGGSDPAVGRVGKGPVIASVLTRLSLDPTRASVVMVGDRSHDVEGAIANGVPAIGVGWGYADPGELADAQLVVPDLDALFLALTGDDARPVACSVGPRPPVAPVDRATPVLPLPVADRRVHGGLPHGRAVPVGAQHLEVGPVPDGEPRRVGRAERHRLGAERTLHGTSSTSAMNCMSRLLAVIPPSTFSRRTGTPESAFIASTTSRVCQPVASSTARARCPR